jgi:excisionase family DNA binding protein
MSGTPRGSTGCTIHVFLPAIVCGWPLALLMSDLFRAKAAVELEPLAKVATAGNHRTRKTLVKSQNACTVSLMATVTQKRADFLTPKQVAYRLGVGVHSVYRAVNRGELPAIRLVPRGAIRVPASAIEPETRG